MSEPLLVHVAADVLAARADVSELLSCTDATLQEARRQREEVRELLQGETEEARAAMQSESFAAETSFEDFLRLAESCRSYASDFDEARLRLVISELPIAAARLQLDLGRLHDALWVCRGPATYSGINQLVALVHSDSELPAIYAAVHLELERMHLWQQGIPESQPLALQPAARAFAQHLREWIERCPSELEHLEPWAQEGESLGADFARFDFHYLDRRHGAGPTPLRLLNLALNAAWLRSEGHVADELVLACFHLLDAELQHLAATISNASAAQAPETLEILNELQALSRRMQRLNHSELSTLRPLAIEVGNELHGALQNFENS